LHRLIRNSSGKWRGVDVRLKIHIVQKEDTFRSIAKEYDIDEHVLIHVNPHIAKPDMILPGIKIKIPQERKRVKNAQRKRFKSKTMRQAEVRNKSVQMRHIPVVAEDDIWENELITMIRSEQKSKPKELEKKLYKQRRHRINNIAFQPVRNNPIQRIRNLPGNDTFEIT